MPRDGNGTYSRTNGVFSGNNTWDQQAASPDPTIRSDQHDVHDQDIADALTGSLARNGEGGMTGQLNMANNKIVNLADSTAEQDVVNQRQVQADAFAWCGTAGGTVNALVLSPSYAISAYAAKQRFAFQASGENDSAVTVNVSGAGVKSLKTFDGKELRPGDLVGGQLVVIEYNGTDFQATSPLSNPRGREGFTISNDYTAKISDDGRTILVDTTAGPVTITLPGAQGAGSGFRILFKKISADTNDVNIAGDGNDTIDGAETITFRHQNDNVTLFCDGTAWNIQSSSTFDLKGALVAAGQTAVTFSGIRAGAKSVVIGAYNLSPTNSVDGRIRVGDSDGMKTTGYVSSSSFILSGQTPTTISDTTGFALAIGTPGRDFHGRIHLTLMQNNKWVSSHSGHVSASATNNGGGIYRTPGVNAGGLTQVEISPLTGTWDAGVIDILVQY